MVTTHVRRFVERPNPVTGDRMFIAVCSCGWSGTAASTKQQTGKLWKRHSERITEKAA